MKTTSDSEAVSDTTQETKRGPGRPPNKTTPETKTNKLTAFLDKPVLESMEDFYAFRDYQRRYKVGERNICFVTPDVYDIVTEGDIGAPLFWSNDVPVVDDSRRQAGLDILQSKHKTETVIIR